MRLHVVFNENGDILGAARLGGDAPVRARPIAGEQAGYRAAEVIVPVEYRHYDLAAVCQRLRVDATGKFPDLKARD
ncbi:MAG TPA: hypothetical protein VHZ03_02450, partial [Trebonia sp.]|jgi:hypothetical protein|nr:hypothetical protein [Trebonia sp.]